MQVRGIHRKQRKNTAAAPRLLAHLKVPTMEEQEALKLLRDLGYRIEEPLKDPPVDRYVVKKEDCPYCGSAIENPRTLGRASGYKGYCEVGSFKCWCGYRWSVTCRRVVTMGTEEIEEREKVYRFIMDNRASK